jgi:hypothetical protein
MYSSRSLEYLGAVAPGPINNEGITTWNHFVCSIFQFVSILNATILDRQPGKLHSIEEFSTFDATPYANDENGILLRKELVPVFERNSLGIDVDVGL